MENKSSDKTMAMPKGYTAWIAELKKRYRATQIKAAISVNSALIEFYWGLGRDISEKYPGKKRGIDFFGVLSHDLRNEISDEGSFSVRNLKYVLNFYKLYAYRQQVVADKPCKGGKSQRVANGKKNSGLCPSVSTRGNEQCLVVELVQVPWGHHIQIISKCKGDREKALFYVRRTIQNGWSRNVLLNWLSTDLYEREGLGPTAIW